MTLGMTAVTQQHTAHEDPLCLPKAFWTSGAPSRQLNENGGNCLFGFSILCRYPATRVTYGEDP